MYFRNIWELKNIQKEFDYINRLLWDMDRASITATEISGIKDSLDGSLKRIGDYTDRINKVWVNKGKMIAAYESFAKLIRSYDDVKLRKVNDRKVGPREFDTLDDRWVNVELGMSSNVSYLNNPNNSRTKDRIHDVSTRAAVVLLTGALGATVLIGSSHLKDVSEDYAKAESEIVRLMNEKDELEKEVDKLKGEIAVLEEQLNHSTSPEESVKLELEIAELREKLAKMEDLKKEYDELAAKYADSLDKIASLEKELSEAQAKGTKDEALIKRLQDEIAKAKAENVDLKDQLANVVSRKDYEDLAAKYGELKTKYDSLNLLYSGVLDENTELKNENTALESENSGLKSTISSLRNDIAGYLLQIDELEDEISTLEESLKEAKDRVKELEEQLANADSSAEVARLQRELADAQKVISQLYSDINKLVAAHNNVVGQLQNKIAVLEANYNSVVRENEQLKQQIAENEAVNQNIDSIYANMFGSGNSGLTREQKLQAIIQRLQDGQGSFSREEIASVLADAFKDGRTKDDFLAMSDIELFNMLIGLIVGNQVEPGEEPTDHPVYDFGESETAAPETGDQGNGGQTGSEGTGSEEEEEISPDHGFVNW